MADVLFSELAEDTALADTDLLVMEDGSTGEYKYYTVATLRKAILAAGGNALTSSSPTITGSGSNPNFGGSTVTGYYEQIGKWFRYAVDISITTGGAYTAGSGAWRFSLPITLHANNIVTAQGYILDISSGEYAGITGSKFVSSTTVELVSVKDTASTTGIGILAATYPFTWATGDVIHVVIQGQVA